MAAVPLNLTIEQATDFEVTFTVRKKDRTPLNLLSYTAESKLRKHYGAPNSISFIVTFIDRINGKVSLSMSSATTTTLKEGRYVYDVVLTSPSNKKSRVVTGAVIVSPGASL
jgi:hypothetical protein